MAGKLLLCAALLLLLTHQAVALKSSARSKRHVQKACNAQRAQRSLLQAGGDAAAPAPAPTGPPLETPEDALTVCSYEEVRKATHCKERKHVFYEEYGAVADEECCKLLSEFYSNASTKATRNCWCDPDVWAREAELELVTYISLGGFFDACAAANYTVGDEQVYYYQDGAGPCAGIPAAAAAAAMEEVAAPVMEKPQKRSFGKWVREGLPDNPWVLFSFIVAIPSIVGFNLMMWPFIFHAVLTVVEFPAKRAAKKAM